MFNIWETIQDRAVVTMERQKDAICHIVQFPLTSSDP